MYKVGGLASPDDQNSQSSELLEHSQSSESLENSQANEGFYIPPNQTFNGQEFDISQFEEIKETGPLRVQELVEPIFGIYIGSEKGKHSPYYILQTTNGKVKIVGVTDLIQKMEKVEVGDLVYIDYKGSKSTEKGYYIHLADVRVKKRDVTAEALQNYGVTKGGN